MTTNEMILVLGGTGKTGGRVARQLTDMGLPVRIGSRSAELPFDWEDQDTWAPALSGVGAVYVAYHTDLAFPGARDDVAALTKVALASGVRRLVLLSGRGEPEAQAAEQVALASGLEVTIVQAAFFAQNFSEHFLLDPVLQGVVAFPAGDVLEPFVDVDDIAEVAVAALTDDHHIGQVYEVTGPRLLSFADAAAEMSAAAGREITYLPVPLEAYREVLALEIGEEYSRLLADLFAHVLDGHNAHLGDGVQRALGREPRDFADYARETAASGVWNQGAM